MRASFAQIEHLATRALAAPGDVAELGVWHGDTFAGLAGLAQQHARPAWAVDSFAGMAEPTPVLDDEEDGVCRYPRGALRVDAAKVQARLRGMGDHVRIVPGYVPASLAQIPDSTRFAFVHLDLDHYAPTLAALEWLWPRMAAGGILCCHDYLPGRKRLATAAIDEWIDLRRVVGVATLTRHIWFQR